MRELEETGVALKLLGKTFRAGGFNFGAIETAEVVLNGGKVKNRFAAGVVAGAVAGTAAEMCLLLLLSWRWWLRVQRIDWWKKGEKILKATQVNVKSGVDSWCQSICRYILEQVV